MNLTYKYCIATFNFVSFLIVIIDKLISKTNNKYFKLSRIPENTLIGLALMGGGWGGLIGFMLANHKLKKLQFMRIYVISTAINVILYVYFFWWIR